jgi:hypothetical protein
VQADKHDAACLNICLRGTATVRAPLGLVGLLVTLAIGYWIYSAQIQEVTNDRPLAQRTNLVAVRSQLLSLAQSEKLYLASNNSYATLEELQQSKIMNSFPDGNRLGYTYAAEVDGAAHFLITATPVDLSADGLPILSIDETMRISQ